MCSERAKRETATSLVKYLDEQYKHGLSLHQRWRQRHYLTAHPSLLFDRWLAREPVKVAAGYVDCWAHIEARCDDGHIA